MQTDRKINRKSENWRIFHISFAEFRLTGVIQIQFCTSIAKCKKKAWLRPAPYTGKLPHQKGNLIGGFSDILWRIQVSWNRPPNPGIIEQIYILPVGCRKPKKAKSPAPFTGKLPHWKERNWWIFIYIFADLGFRVSATKPWRHRAKIYILHVGCRPKKPRLQLRIRAHCLIRKEFQIRAQLNSE